MKRIKKYFNSMKQAESFLNKLYDKYDFVQLVSFPMFSTRGTFFQLKQTFPPNPNILIVICKRILLYLYLRANLGK